MRRNFNGILTHYENMRPASNQPGGRLVTSTKTHKFNSLDEMAVQNLKLRSKISQAGTYTYNGAKTIADYLKS